MTHIIGKHILLTAEAVLAAFPPRAEATGLPSDATHVISLLAVVFQPLVFKYETAVYLVVNHRANL